jgi:putative membrane protein
MANTPSDSQKTDANTPVSQTKHSKVNTVWVSIAFVVIILALFVAFVAQNAQDVTVHFLWMDGTISLALALIIATFVGVVITFIIGSIRIWQLNHKNKQS